MLLARFFPKDTDRYHTVSKSVKFLDRIISWRPERWFGGWCMVLSGANVVAAADNRYFYWDWSTFSILLLILMILGGLWAGMVSKFPVFPNRVDSIQAVGFFLAVGALLFLIGSISVGFGLATLLNGIPYLLIFLSVWIVYSIEIKMEGELIIIPSKKEQIGNLVSSIAILALACFLAFRADDPLASTVAAIYLPFPVVVLVFPTHVRHLQRARMYGIFIPAMFLSVRFPWFLIPLAVVFFGLRFYHYFNFGIVQPTFKVDHD